MASNSGFVLTKFAMGQRKIAFEVGPGLVVGCLSLLGLAVLLKKACGEQKLVGCGYNLFSRVGCAGSCCIVDSMLDSVEESFEGKVGIIGLLELAVIVL